MIKGSPVTERDLLRLELLRRKAEASYAGNIAACESLLYGVDKEERGFLEASSIAWLDFEEECDRLLAKINAEVKGNL